MIASPPWVKTQELTNDFIKRPDGDGGGVGILVAGTCIAFVFSFAVAFSFILSRTKRHVDIVVELPAKSSCIVKDSAAFR